MTYLVGTEHVFVKDLASDGLDQGMSNPGAIMTGGDLAELVSANLVHGDFVGPRIVLDGDLGGHATHGSDLAPMASLDEEPDIGVHERYRHGDILAVGEDSATVSPALLDEAEDVVPAKNRDMRTCVPKLPDDVTKHTVHS